MKRRKRKYKSLERRDGENEVREDIRKDMNKEVRNKEK